MCQLLAVTQIVCYLVLTASSAAIKYKQHNLVFEITNMLPSGEVQHIIRILKNDAPVTVIPRLKPHKISDSVQF